MKRALARNKGSGPPNKRQVAPKRTGPQATKHYVCLGCEASFDIYSRPQQFINHHHYGPDGMEVCKESLHRCIACPYKGLYAKDLDIHYGARSNLQCCIARNKRTLIMNRVDTANASGMRVVDNSDDVLHTQSYQPFISNNEYNDNLSRFGGSQSILQVGSSNEPVIASENYHRSLHVDEFVTSNNGDENSDISFGNNENDDQSFHNDDFGRSSNNDVNSDTSIGNNEDSRVTVHEAASRTSDRSAVSTNLNCFLRMKEIMDDNEKNMSKDQWFVAGVELENILSDANVPLHVTDKLFSWAIKHKDHLPSRMTGALKRHKIYKSAAMQMYGELDKLMLPQHHHIVLPSRRKVSIVKFDVKAQIFSILDCPFIDGSILQHLIFDNHSNENPFDVLLKGRDRRNGVYNDIETSVWFQETLRKLNLDPREFIVVPLILFLDATNIGGNSSHSLEPLMMTLGILKRQLRNDPRAWKTVGYVEEMSRILGSSNLTPAEKLEDYHFILKLLMQDIKDLISSGPVEWVFVDRNTGQLHRRKMLFRVMMIIGDTKGADTWVGRYGSHWNTVGLARDCDIKTCFADDPDHKCNILHFDDLDNMSADELAKLSMRRIVHNAFREPADLFGASPYGICTATPPEPLHAVLLGIMIRLFQFFVANLTEKQWLIVLEEIPSIVSDISKQSCQSEYPDCRKFKTGNLGQGHLSGKQKYSRMVLIYIALAKTSVFESFVGTYGKTPKVSKDFNSNNKVDDALNDDVSEKEVEDRNCNSNIDDDEFSIDDADSNCNDEDGAVSCDENSDVGGNSIESGFRSIDSDGDQLYSGTGKNSARTPERVFFDVDGYNKLLLVLEETIAMYEWLMKEDGHPKKDFEGGCDSLIAQRLREFMKMYKRNAPRLVGMGLKLYKFHIIKKWYFYIVLFGSPHNFDGSRPESGHKLHAKNTGNRTQKRADTINFQTAMRYYEKNLIERTAMACNIYLRRPKIERANADETSFLSDVNKDELEDTALVCTGRGPFFKIQFSFNDDGKICTPKLVWLSSGTNKVNHKTKRTTFSQKLMSSLVEKFRFYNGGQGGRRINSVRGCCEATISRASDSSKMFKLRADPCYRSGSAKNDFVKIHWDEEGILPACVMLMIDYSTCEFESPTNETFLHVDVSTTMAVASDNKIGMHAIVQSCTRNLPEIDGKDRPLPRSMNIQLAEHFYMEEDDDGHKQYQILPCDRILAKVLAVTDSVDDEGNLDSILVFEHISQWHTIFYDYNDTKDDLSNSGSETTGEQDENSERDIDDEIDEDDNSFCWESIE